MFKRKKDEKIKDPAEVRFERIMSLVKDLDKNDYKRLKKAMDSGYEAYNTVRNIETEDICYYDCSNDDIDNAESLLEKEAK